MIFLNAGLLAAAMAAGIPILIHLFSRPRRREMDFSTLRFLKRLEQKRLKRLSITQWILLALRILAVLAVVLAFARPALKNTASALAGDTRTSAAIIIDNSIASQTVDSRGSLISQEKMSAVSILELFQPGDEILLITGAEPAGIIGSGPFPGGGGKIRAEIFSIEESGGGFDFQGSLKIAREFLSNSSAPNRELYIFSPFFIPQRELAHLDSLPERVNLIPVLFGSGKLSNLAIVKTEIETQIIQPQAPVTLCVTAANYSDENRMDIPISVFLGEERAADGNIDIAPHSESTIRFKIIPESGGVNGGYCRLEAEDALQADNRRYFSFKAMDEAKTALIGDPQEIKLVELALQPSAKNDLPVKSVKISDPNEMSSLTEFDAVFLLGIERISPYLTGKLKEVLNRGGGLLIAPSIRTDIQSLNRVLMDEIGAPGLGEVVTSSEGIRWDKVDFDHPLFEGVFLENRAVESPLFHKRCAVYENAGYSVIEFNSAQSYLREIHSEGGKILLFSSGFTSDWSDISRRGIFAPLIYRCAVYLASGGKGSVEEYTAGGIIEYITERAEGRYSIVLPDGSQSEILPAVSTRALLLKYGDTGHPGLYRLQINDNTAQIFAVNPSVESSPLIQPEGLDEYINSPDESVDLAAFITSSRMGVELWRWMLAAAMLFLILETAIARMMR
ncbi:BatA domain-containing protein [bacterium]|nr:BatA domain-containing protein [bacterium]